MRASEESISPREITGRERVGEVQHIAKYIGKKKLLLASNFKFSRSHHHSSRWSVKAISFSCALVTLLCLVGTVEHTDSCTL